VLRHNYTGVEVDLRSDTEAKKAILKGAVKVADNLANDAAFRDFLHSESNFMLDFVRVLSRRKTRKGYRARRAQDIVRQVTEIE